MKEELLIIAILPVILNRTKLIIRRGGKIVE